MSQPDMTTWQCSTCKTRRLGWCNPCPVCGGWNTIAKDRIEKPSPPQGSLPYYSSDAAATDLEAAKRATGLRAVPLSEIAAVEIKRIRSWEPFDEVMAGGFPCGTTCLLDGAKGLGKSTLATHVALCWPSKSCYLTAEAGQGPAFVAARANRIAPSTLFDTSDMNVLKIDRIDLDRWDAIHTILAEYSLIILDSLQGFTPNYREQLDLTRLLGKSAEKTGACVLLLSRVNGRGETAGWEELPHQVDACLSLVEHADCHAELVATKNRNGPLARVLLSMGPHGMHKEVVVPAEESPSEF